MKRLTASVKIDPAFSYFPVRLHIRSDIHLARKIWHFSTGLLIVFLYNLGISRLVAVSILGFLLVLSFLIEVHRLKNFFFNQRIIKFLGPIMREHEAQQMCTIIHYLSGVLFAIILFPRSVAVLSILYLACGDPMASLFGILYGNKAARFSNGKSVVGTAAGISVCALVTFFYLKSFFISSQIIFIITIIGGFAGGLVELFPFEIDDNFTIPILSGFVLWILFMIFGI